MACLYLAALPAAAESAPTHLDIMVPHRLDTDLTGPVKSVDTKTSINVSGQFERERREYDRTGNLLNETNWDPEGECLTTLTNCYDEGGCLERELFIDFEDGYTNEWEVLLNPETQQIAMRQRNGTAAVYRYSPDGYLMDFRFMNADKSLRYAFVNKRDENNRRLEYKRLDENRKPVFTYWFKWKEKGFIDRERQSYRKDGGERLHVYDYLETDAHGNWTQRLMVRYDITDGKKQKMFERLVARTVEYFEEDIKATADTAASPETDVADPAGGAGDTDDGFSYTFDDISDKLVIITCRRGTERSAGSGFIAKMDGRTYLLTNQHVIMGAETIRLKTAAGTELSPLQVELSKTRDIARILIEDRDGFEVNRKFALGIPIGVFGNSEGAGVATELFGEVTDFGADLVEVTAEFVSGNSGSPVLDRDRQVIGIASYVRVHWEPSDDDENTAADEGEEGEKEDGLQSKTRRFCYRLTDVEWQPVNWKDYNNRYGKLYFNSKELYDNVFAILGLWANAPLEKIPEEDMAYDLAEWVKKHNDIIGRVERRGYKQRAFLNAYSDSLEMLSDTCRARSRRTRMFSSQRELTGYLREQFENHSDALEYASLWIQSIADDI